MAPHLRSRTPRREYSYNIVNNIIYVNNIVNKIFPLNRISLNLNPPWRKFRIGIHSKPIRTIPNHSDICIRSNPNQSAKRFESRLLKNVWKLIRLNPIQSERIRIKPNTYSIGLKVNPIYIFQFRLKFQSEWIKVRIDSDWIFRVRIELKVNSKAFSSQKIRKILLPLKIFTTIFFWQILSDLIIIPSTWNLIVSCYTENDILILIAYYTTTNIKM